MKDFLSKFLSNGLLILLVIAVLYILFLRECKKPEPCPAEGEILVPLTVWNKIQELANKPAEVHIDTVWKERPVVEPDPQPPLPDPQTTIDTTIVTYQDSLINKEINVWVDYKIKGLLVDRKWRYKPISSTIRIDSIIYVPKIVDKEIFDDVPQNGFYAYGIAGGNTNSFLFGGGLDYITKKNTELGYMYQRFGEINFHSVKLGIKIFNKNN
jgi:hypothetical protein